MPSKTPGRPKARSGSGPRLESEARQEPAQEPEQQEPTGPRVSAVLVAFNQADELRRAIKALERSQGAERIEILIVDCGSHDDSPNLDTEFPSVQILRLPQNFGATRAMNIAVRTSKAELLFFLSPQLEVLPDTILRLADAVEEDSATSAVCPLLLDPDGKPVARTYRIPTAADLAAGVLRIAAIDAEAAEPVTVEYASRDALMVRKQFVRGINYFDERFGEYWADLDLAMQIHRAGRKIRAVPAIRATLHPADDPLRDYPGAQADRIVGAATFLGKYNGFAAGFKFRAGAILRALLAFNFKRLSLLMAGQHLGSQAGR